MAAADALVDGLSDLFPEWGPDVLVPTATAYGLIAPGIKLTEWRRQGTWIERWRGTARIAFAPHQSYSSVYFKDREAVPIYHELGGTCPTGLVTIKLPHAGGWDPDPVCFVINQVWAAG